MQATPMACRVCGECLIWGGSRCAECEAKFRWKVRQMEMLIERTEAAEKRNAAVAARRKQLGK